MSVLAARGRHEQYQRERELLSMRDMVSAAVVAKNAFAGSSAIADAVDEALAQLVAADQHLGEPAEVRNAWILYASRRVIDEQRSAEAKHRDPVAIDEHAQALALSAAGELPGSTDDAGTDWRVRELLGQLRGDQRRWAEAWYDEILAGTLPPGGQPRGLAETFGWSASKTKSTSKRARQRMAAFTDARAHGLVCLERRTALDDFVLATSTDDHAPADLDQDHFEEVLFHIAACEDCWALWHTRRRSLRGRAIAILTLPLGWFADVAHALRAHLAALIGHVHGASYSLRQRLGIGGSTGAAAAGGSAAAIGKAGAICGAVACAAGAAGGVVVEAGSSILPPALRASVHHATHRSQPRKPIAAAHLASYTPPPATTTATQATSTAAATTSPPTVPAQPKSATFTPGDLSASSASQPPTSSNSTPATNNTTGTAASTSAAAPPKPAARSAARQGQPSCTPGDLTC